MRDSRKRPLAVAVLLSLSATCGSNAVADTVIVDRCDDPLVPVFGTTLRQAIDLARQIDLVDLSGLACSTITLEQGELVVLQNSLSLLGPTDHTLTIDANGNGRAIHHYGTGTLYFDYLGAANGATTGNGGCIESSGKLELSHSTLSHCSASGNGGGAYAPDLRVSYSQITGNSVGSGRGAGLSTPYSGYIRLEHSDVLDNTVPYTEDCLCSGGALRAYTIKIYDSTIARNSAPLGGAISSPGFLYLTRTTISGNTASVTGGVLAGGASHTYVTDSTIDNNSSGAGGIGGFIGHDFNIVNSTISGNTGGYGGAAFGWSFEIRNSTIVGNTETYSPFWPGGIYASVAATIISSIIAKNTSVASAADVVVGAGGLTTYTSLIMSANVPNVSLTGDPRLGPLADHGGGRRTHAILPGSPVIDVGSNPLNLQNDERGLPRKVGPKPDIGAFERQADDDQLFYDGFE